MSDVAAERIEAAVREWCPFCQQVFVVSAQESCPRVCDGGTHEGLARDGGEVRQGSSLHEGGCPRSNPSPDLPRTVPCLCRAAVSPQPETTTPEAIDLVRAASDLARTTNWSLEAALEALRSISPPEYEQVGWWESGYVPPEDGFTVERDSTTQVPAWVRSEDVQP